MLSLSKKADEMMRGNSWMLELARFLTEWGSLNATTSLKDLRRKESELISIIAESPAMQHHEVRLACFDSHYDTYGTYFNFSLLLDIRRDF